MSMEIMVLVNKHKFDSPLKKLIFLQLADNADKSGKCWPSYAYIADTSGCGKSTVRKHIKELKELGYLSVINRKGEKGNASNIYVINKTALCDTPMPPDSTGVCHEIAQGESPDSIPLCHEVAPESVTLEPVIESVKNKTKKVFEYWKKTFNHPRAVFDSARETKIKNALKHYSVDDLMLAIDGCSKSPHHMGKNKTGTIHDSIDLIFRNAGNIERFIGYNQNKTDATQISGKQFESSEMPEWVV